MIDYGHPGETHLSRGGNARLVPGRRDDDATSEDVLRAAIRLGLRPSDILASLREGDVE